MSFRTGVKYVFVPDAKEKWLPAELITEDVVAGHTVRVVGETRTRTLSPAESELASPCGQNMARDVENLVELEELSEGMVLYHVRARFHRDTIYTLVGSILVASTRSRRCRSTSARAWTCTATECTTPRCAAAHLPHARRKRTRDQPGAREPVGAHLG